MSELVTFFIGPTKTKFIIHKQIACEASPVLKAAFNSSFVEGQTQTYTLIDTPEATFALFTEWMYTGNIVNRLTGDTPAVEVGLAEAHLLELWVLAEKLLVPKIQNRALCLFEEIRDRFSKVCIYKYKYVWENTADGCTLRAYLLNVLVRCVLKKAYQTQKQCFTVDILVDAAILLRDILDSGCKLLPLPAVETFYVMEESE
ncbi:hypothetical protein ONS95_008200 [Cadophora gregata]|uniref:uncharacterized protein n=1 Tax=Cadophora gregata TaxID=51156 RepID=UPI0026DB73C5|nr:uncharacterized protein ONS95_008200 [Cadophora gregata]KAK0126612.1 hypothetical protein ONS95_008200 [Cadophora gregata]